MMNGSEPDKDKEDKVKEALELLDKFLDGKDWLVGEHMTIADISIVVSVSTAEACGIETSSMLNLTKWYKRCKEGMADCGYEECVQKGSDTIAEIFKKKLESNQ